MDMTNKQIRITRTQMSGLPARTIADVDVLSELDSGARKIDGSFEFTFDESYAGPSDPLLLSAVAEKLAAI